MILAAVLKLLMISLFSVTVSLLLSLIVTNTNLPVSGTISVSVPSFCSIHLTAHHCPYYSLSLHIFLFRLYMFLLSVYSHVYWSPSKVLDITVYFFLFQSIKKQEQKHRYSLPLYTATAKDKLLFLLRSKIIYLTCR